MANENGKNGQVDEQKMQRLNRLAVIVSMAAVLFFLVTLIGMVLFPPPPPASTPPSASPTPTPTLTPTPTPSPTATPAPQVELISVEYIQPGVGCQVDVTVYVSGDALEGVFHVWNASHDDPAGSMFAAESLPPGVSSGHLLTLSGDQPAFYAHEIWFEYQGGASNRLTGIVCPGLTPAP